MEEVDENKCVFCNEGISDTDNTNVVKKGLKTIRDTSIARGDNLHRVLETKQSVTVHVKCRKNYTRHVKVNSVPLPIDNNQSIVTLRKSIDNFVFKEDCLLCGKTAKFDDWKKHPDRYDAISYVTTSTFSETLASRASLRNDEWGRLVQLRVGGVIDLVAAKAKYHRNCLSTFMGKTRGLPGVGTPVRGLDTGKYEAFLKLCEFMENDDECQFLLSELHQRMSELSPCKEVFCEKTLKIKLEEHFGPKIICTTRGKLGTIVTFRNVASRIMVDEFFKIQEGNFQDERMRIVMMAAEIIKEDIKSVVYTPEYYPSVNKVKSGDRDMVPDSLITFLETVTKSRAGNINSQKTLSLAHAVMSAVRSSSFVSPIQLGTSVYLHRKYRSRSLIDIFNAMGFCASYKETLNYESSITEHAQVSIDESAFVQYVFDNADHNVCTIDGHGSFHVMGGIVCATPARLVNSELPVPRLSEMPSSASIGKFGCTDVKMYSKPYKTGLKKIKLKDISQLSISSTSVDVSKYVDLLWMAGLICKLDNHVGWSGYMDTITKSEELYETSAVLPLPIVNLEPSNPSTIYTCLAFAVDQCKKQKQSSCIVTFDQPLYVKAMDIVLAAEKDNPLSSIVVRLGGFHLLMSFMGAVGKIMEGSGLEELWETVFAKNSVRHMLKGHAYARALRAHFLAQSAVWSLIVERCKTDGILPDDEVEVKKNYELLFQGEKSVCDVLSSENINRYIDAINKQIQYEGERGRTSKFWVQYLDQVEIMRLFVRAERSGDWNLHLLCVKRMLPYLHAGGHTNYAKSAHLYLQQMTELELTLSKTDYEEFVGKGYFTVRRSSKFWSGIWSDMTIEQVLMKNLKTTGGLTRGHGISDAILARWIHSMSASMNMVEALESFAGVSTTTSLQHIELGKSCQKRDAKHFEIFKNWLQLHSPFDKPADILVSLSTGLIGDASVNCDSALEVGTTAMMEVQGKSFAEVKLRRNNKVKPLSAMENVVVVRGETVPINQNKLFHRIMCVVRSDTELKSCFKYELAPLPPALFNNVGIRKSNKAALRTMMEKLCPPVDCLPPAIVPHFVIDGGHLLHRVVWPKPAIFDDICMAYQSYIMKHYGNNVTVVFDGYSESTTKDVEHARRMLKASSAEVLVDSDVQVVSQQHPFLANASNKTRLITLLGSHLNKNEIPTLHAQADADCRIIQTAIKLAKEGKNAVIVGEDTDLFVLLLTLCDPETNIQMLIPPSKAHPQKIFSSMALQKSMSNVNEHLLFLHAMSGCDTTSAPYRKGKIQAYNVLKKSPRLRQSVDVFNRAEATQTEIIEAGEEFLVALYGGKSGDGLNTTRYKLYLKAISKQRLDVEFDLSTLPPTSKAAREHSLRVYHQVQEWRGICLSPTEWGWKKNEMGKFTPIPTSLPPLPDNLLNLISCACKAGCNRYCGCLKNGLSCSRLCIYCTDGCGNKINATTVLNEEEDVYEPNSPSQSSSDRVTNTTVMYKRPLCSKRKILN